MLARLRRSWRHTRSPDILHTLAYTILPAIVSAVVAWMNAEDRTSRTSEVLYPAIAFMLVLLASVVLLYGVLYTIRFIWQRAPKGSPRTLYGLNTRNLERVLAESVIPGEIHNLRTYSTSLEAQDFGAELNALLKRSGWAVDFAPGTPWDALSGANVRDVQIHLPDEGDTGLLELAAYLHKHGYRVTVHPGHGSSTAQIEVGEATH